MTHSSARAQRLLYLWTPVVFYAALIFFLSSFSFDFLWFATSQKNHTDKLTHIVEYTLFGFLLGRALYGHSAFWGTARRMFAAALLIGALYAASDEWHQSFVPGREASTQDFAVDTLGVAFGAWLWLKKHGSASSP